MFQQKGAGEQERQGSRGAAQREQQEVEESVCFSAFEDYGDAYSEFLGRDQHDRRTLAT
jgi:hypothetical protein